MALPVALQLYSVRQDAAHDLRGTLEKVKEMGYVGVEFAGLCSHSPEEVKRMCEEIGLVPLSAHVSYGEMVADPHKIFSDYSSIGCSFMAIPYLVEDDRPGTDNFYKVIENAKMLGGVAKEYGIQLLYHNHDFEFVKIDGKYALDMLYDSVDADLLMTELDTCWVNVGGEDPAAYIRKYSGRSPVLHLKDFFGERSEDMYELIGIEKKTRSRPKNFEYRPLGSGMQNIPEILEAAESAGVEWLVVEQDQPSMGLTPLECAQKSREYLATLGY